MRDKFVPKLSHRQLTDSFARKKRPVLSGKGIWTAVALDRSALVSFSNLNWGRLPYGVGTPLLCAETLMTALGRMGCQRRVQSRYSLI